MKKTVILLLVMSFIGCKSLPTTDEVRTKNRENLAKLSVGISKANVLQLMGTETITTEQNWKINNPYRVETLKGNDEKYYEVLFYYTDLKKGDNAITDDELMPIVLKNGKVIGWGWGFLNDNVTKYQYQIDIR